MEPQCIGHQYATRLEALMAIGSKEIQPAPGQQLRVEACGDHYHVIEELRVAEGLELPPGPDLYGLATSCHGKRQYLDEKEARRVARQIHERNGDPLRAYRCEACGYYHLTSQIRKGPMAQEIA